MQHGTIIRAGLTYKKILLQKSIEFGIPLSTIPQNLILIFTLYERTKKDKREFVTKFVGIVVTVMFI